MRKFEKIYSKVIPLPLKDIDTDMIIPAQFLTSISSSGYADALFRRLRDQDPEFVWNKPEFAGASILIAESNFGCGSSREHAVWALLDGGIRVVIAKSFADIFFSNSAKNGLVTVRLPPIVIDSLMCRALDCGLSLSVDLAAQIVTDEVGDSYRFEFDEFRKHCILGGQDDLDYLLARKDEINRFKDRRDLRRFFVSTAPNHPLESLGSSFVGRPRGSS